MSKPKHRPKPQPSSLNLESCPHLLRLRDYLSEEQLELWAEANTQPTELWLACGRCERNVLLAAR
jgi:hypothetical protein